MTKEDNTFEKKYHKMNHCCYFKCAGITICLESDLPITEEPFYPAFKLFLDGSPGEDMIFVQHRSTPPNLDSKDLGKVMYQKYGWTISKKGESWLYLHSTIDNRNAHIVAIFNKDHSLVRIYGNGSISERSNRYETYTNQNEFYSDLLLLIQTALSQVLANRRGCIFHSSGVIIGGKCFLFPGHSGAGKSTLRKMILSTGIAETLCDDKNVVRRWSDGYYVHGIWANQNISDVSTASIPLGAIMFLEQSERNQIVPLLDTMEIIKRLLPCTMRPANSAEWWDKSLALVSDIAKKIPCYRIKFDLSGEIVGMIEDVCR